MKQRLQYLVPVLSTILLAVLTVRSAGASIALLMEEPYGRFGAFNPTGHAAVYLDHVCAQNLTQLRMCHSGEYGVVISRYHRVGGYDWVAVPLIPYLYAVSSVEKIPRWASKEEVSQLRDAYRRRHLESVAPDTTADTAPRGEWVQLVGSSYDRKIHGFEVETTREQDERFIASMNDRRNVGHFNLFFHNCADFSKGALNLFLPHAIHRNFIADAGITTPKQVGRSLVKYGRKHPELRMSAFVIPQVRGDMPRSHSVDGVAESLAKSKKYILPLAVLNPEISGAIIVAYLADGRLKMPKDVRTFDLGDAQVVDSPESGSGEIPALAEGVGQE
ncbi:MAG TPA: hypothetical protein VHN81_09630 [Edaphobacter sp.]|nr:hypothetical protein [Edaphobacter sp.]